MDPNSPVSLSWVARATLVVLALVALFWLLGQTANILLMLFGAVTIAVVLRAAGNLVHKVTHLPSSWSLGLAIALVGLIFGVFVMLMGNQLVTQFSGLNQQLPEAVEGLGDMLGVEDLWQEFEALNEWRWMFGAMGYVPQLLGAVSGLTLIVIGGIFLAVDPDLYIEGTLKLVPPNHRDHAREVLQTTGRALRLWLLGKLLAMAVIGVATTAGLFLLGVPSALALGAIAGLLEYVPFIGPVLSFVPAALVALQQDDGTIWWVLGLYLLIQQTESNLLVPLIQKRTVELPPVLGLFAIVALGLVFGPLGFIFGIPLTIVVMVMVKELYVREALDTEVKVPGADHENP
ncbi:AI-2E family transporter [Devosia pacifica]|uniref:AI-2E family transporter n=1 Tax=Devosia pacifica TaxID=1335967 RepID=A0A918S7D0_9HYPH|nr:AI-2E family transporter [Devosia pacifica]GHA25298.1 AI-2E family transporter [Devosia pacifica]